MEYLSTRGGGAPASGAAAIRQGIAPDGGLFVPAFFPPIERETLAQWRDLSYPELALALLTRFFPEFSGEVLTAAVTAAYSREKFPDPAVTPVRPAGELAFLELWHGPTCAFKDLALQLLPRLLTAAMDRSGCREESVILTATSGDTGKAALAGFAGVAGTRIIVFYPAAGVSLVQERQMLTQEGDNVYVVAVEGNFDDAQSAVKAVFTDTTFRSRLAAAGLAFSSANSINWGRLAPQIVYYFYGYLELVRQGRLSLGTLLNIVVPTGNFGNILAAYYAKRMGLPVGRLICASNRNNVLTDFFQSGRYDRRRPFYRTISPSMDILVSSNLERLLFEVAGRDCARVRAWMEALRQEGFYTVESALAARLREEFWGGYADEAETRAALAGVYREYGYLVDPHTAVAVHVYQRYRQESGDRRPALLAATASPFKFPRSVAEALWGEGVGSQTDEFALLDFLAERLQLTVPPGLRDLREKPIRHRRRCGRQEVAQTVAEILGL